MSLSVYIVDDHPIFRHGLEQIVQKSNEFTVVGAEGDGAAAAEQMAKLKPNIAILDVHLPSLDGLKIARRLQGMKPEISVIFLTMNDDEATFNAAMDVGARGYILKENAVQDLLIGLKAVAAGGMYFSPSVSHHLLRRNQRASALREKKTGLKTLTETERCVLRLVGQNKTNKEIGQELFISHRTVEAHRANICAKLELKGNRALFLFAVQHKSELG
ncbi:MAG TPA: response regulator transcription factor [Methylomirabilota bacterium]|nr:response regulator transcription factor [Methylomirabilota bacterium]